MEYTRVAKSVLGFANASVSGKSPAMANSTNPAKPSKGPRPTSHNSSFHGMRFMGPSCNPEASVRGTFQIVVSKGA